MAKNSLTSYIDIFILQKDFNRAMPSFKLLKYISQSPKNKTTCCDVLSELVNPVTSISRQHLRILKYQIIKNCNPYIERVRVPFIDQQIQALSHRNSNRFLYNRLKF